MFYLEAVYEPNRDLTRQFIIALVQKVCNKSCPKPVYKRQSLPFCV